GRAGEWPPALRSQGALPFRASLYLVATTGDGTACESTTGARQAAPHGVAGQHVAAGGVPVEGQVALNRVASALAEVPRRAAGAPGDDDVAIDGGVTDDVGA